MSGPGNSSEDTYQRARAAAERAASEADVVARAEGWELGGGLWQDEASDRLYDRKAELGALVYDLACELQREPQGRPREA